MRYEEEAAVAVGPALLHGAGLVAQVVGDDGAVFVDTSLHLFGAAACEQGDGSRGNERSGNRNRTAHGAESLSLCTMRRSFVC
ncbi:hypothetical protein GCM10022270_00410 [Terriglobus aquaticus]